MKSAEHQGDPTVLLKMRDALDAAADLSQVGTCRRPQELRGIASFRRYVNMPLGIERRRPHEEELLSLDNFPDGLSITGKSYPTSSLLALILALLSAE
jgi:hypothetical protein